MTATTRRDSTSYELYEELRHIDRRFAEDYNDVVHKLLGKIRGKLMYAARLWIGDVARNGVASPVQDSSTTPKHEAFVDWLDDVHKTLERLVAEAP